VKRCARALAWPVSNETIRIEDLAHPILGEAQQAALAYGESVETELSVPAVLGAARERTGLDDFGPEDFRERLDLWLSEMDAEDTAPVQMELPNIERDSAGIPTLVFRDDLAENDKPSQSDKALEVTLFWREAVMSVGHYTEVRPITIGEHLKNDFRVASDLIPIDQFPLVDVVDGQFVVHWSDGMVIEVRDADGVMRGEGELKKDNLLEDAGAADGKAVKRYPIGLYERIAVQAGEVTFVLQFVSPAKLVPSSFLKTIDLYFTRVLSVSFAAHVLVVLALLLMPYDIGDPEEDLFKNPNRFAKLLLTEVEKPKPQRPTPRAGRRGGGKPEKEEGKFGEAPENEPDAMASKPGARNYDPNKRERDRKVGHGAVLLGALSGSNSTSVSNVLGPGGLGTGINEAMGGDRDDSESAA